MSLPILGRKKSNLILALPGREIFQPYQGQGLKLKFCLSRNWNIPLHYGVRSQLRREFVYFYQKKCSWEHKPVCMLRTLNFTNTRWDFGRGHIFFFLHHFPNPLATELASISSPKQHPKINTRSDWLLLLRWGIANYLVWLWDFTLYVHIYTHLYQHLENCFSFKRNLAVK